MSLKSEASGTLRQPPPLMRIKNSPYRGPSMSKGGGKDIVVARHLYSNTETREVVEGGPIMPSISSGLSWHRAHDDYDPKHDRVRKLSPDHLSNGFSEPEEIEDVRRHVMPQMVEDTPSTRSFPQLKNPSKAYKSSFLSELVKDEDEEQHEQSEDLTVSIGLTTHKYSSLNSTVESYTKQDQPGSIPILTNMRGEFDFDVHLGERENSTKSPNWLTSSITKKLYTLMNKAIPFNPTFGGELVSDFTERFTIRAMAVFTSQQSLRSTVIRCPNHIAESDSTNRDFPYPDHVIRADHPHAVYEGQDGERRSVIVPLETQGDSYMPILLRFMCLGSCVGGINRRPIAVVLTLESKGRIYGRKIIRVRVCACPTRDIKSDENQMVIKETGKRIIPDTQHPKLVKKIRSLPDNDRLVLSVEGSQLIRMMLHFGESYLQCHPEYARKFPNEELREKARRYLHSPDM
ncbi:cellular tumor antigen p53-like isoform X3 [Oratosquilla oratoria]|uniref:cellular tumor antigen p53-like isoform X3 n=1 Tax=Oratosquilla oratoria TaxID=337810 RepID=UPI003F77320B